MWVLFHCVLPKIVVVVKMTHHEKVHSEVLPPLLHEFKVQNMTMGKHVLIILRMPVSYGSRHMARMDSVHRTALFPS